MHVTKETRWTEVKIGGSKREVAVTKQTKGTKVQKYRVTIKVDSGLVYGSIRCRGKKFAVHHIGAWSFDGKKEWLSIQGSPEEKKPVERYKKVTDAFEHVCAVAHLMSV